MDTTTDPSRLIDLFLEKRKRENAASTVQNNRYHLKQFRQWLDDNGIDDITEVSGMSLLEYRIFREDQHDVNRVTLRNNFYTLRAFFHFCEEVGAMPQGFAENITTPTVDTGEDTRDTAIKPERANQILDYLGKFEYATTRHALFLTLWHTGLRLGGLRTLDLGDFNREAPFGNDLGSLEIRHRPETGTPLKNKAKGERIIALSPEVRDVLADYVDMNRHDVTDDHGREPFFTSREGRLYPTSLRQYIHELTRPCDYTGECPVDGRDMETCEAREYDYVNRCPESVSPHPVRRSAITHHLNAGWSKVDTSERMNVSADVLDKHYDVRTEEEKAAKRVDRYFSTQNEETSG